MTTSSFPDGHYFCVVERIRVSPNEATRLALLRHRLLQTHINLTIPIVTFDPQPNYDAVRESLLAERLIRPSSQIINMHEWLQHRQYPNNPNLIPVPAATSFTVEAHHDLSPDSPAWRVLVHGAHAGETHWDYLRPDGTRYLRTPADSVLGTTQVFDHQEKLVVDLDGIGDLWRWWFTQLCDTNSSAFLFSDCPVVAFELSLMNEPHIHLLHQIHEPHVGGAHRWNSPTTNALEPLLENLGELDALIIPTESQRNDIEKRFAGKPNLFVIPNTSAPFSTPSPLPKRIHGRVVMVEHLEPHHRIDLALSAFAIVAQKNAVARLEIYGEGSERGELERLIDQLELNERVSLFAPGTDPASQWWTADIGWTTSAAAVYGQSLLEGRLHACPFVAFDVPYGAIEQIVHGVDGVLVPDGDLSRFADETLTLLADPERLESMREPAREDALANNIETYAQLWSEACHRVAEQKPQRTHIECARLSRLELHLHGSHPRLNAQVILKGTGDRSGINVRWQMWVAESPEPVDLPVEFNLEGDEIHISGLAVARDLPFAADDPHATGRILIEWNNSSRSFDVTRKETPSKVKQFAQKVRNRLRD